jgi:hypothetical protein
VSQLADLSRNLSLRRSLSCPHNIHRATMAPSAGFTAPIVMVLGMEDGTDDAEVCGVDAEVCGSEGRRVHRDAPA